MEKEIKVQQVKEKKTSVNLNKPKVSIGAGKDYLFVKNIVSSNNLNTICQSGNCPNIAECWGNRTATFMILGNICTRGCRFCSVPTGKPALPDQNEPEEVAKSVSLMQLKSCVITSVDRDDLTDYGAFHWKKVILKVKELNPEIKIEVLIPDFNGESKYLDIIAATKPDIISHNIETVRNLSPSVRPNASYQRTLDVLKYLFSKNIKTKSGIMVGLGEGEPEIIETFKDIYNTGCRIMTVGQYLQPEKSAMEVKRFYSDEDFYQLKMKAYGIGFEMVESGKLIRSSYHAEKHHT